MHPKSPPGGGGGSPLPPAASVSAAQTPRHSSANPPASPAPTRSPTARDASQPIRADPPAPQAQPHQTLQEQETRYGISSPTRTFHPRHTPTPAHPSSQR